MHQAFSRNAPRKWEMHQAFSEMHQGKRENATWFSHSIKIVVRSHNSTLILIELGCCSFSQKPQYFWAFQRFKADPGSSRDRPFFISIDFSVPLPIMGSLDYRRVRWFLGAVRWIIERFVGLLRGSLDYRGSSLDLHPRAKSWLVNTAIVRAVFSAVLSKRLF